MAHDAFDLGDGAASTNSSSAVSCRLANGTYDFFRLLGDMDGSGNGRQRSGTSRRSSRRFLSATTDPLYLGARRFRPAAAASTRPDFFAVHFRELPEIGADAAAELTTATRFAALPLVRRFCRIAVHVGCSVRLSYRGAGDFRELILRTSHMIGASFPACSVGASLVGIHYANRPRQSWLRALGSSLPRNR